MLVGILFIINEYLKCNDERVYLYPKRRERAVGASLHEEQIEAVSEL